MGAFKKNTALTYHYKLPCLIHPGVKFLFRKCLFVVKNVFVPDTKCIRQGKQKIFVCLNKYICETPGSPFLVGSHSINTASTCPSMPLPSLLWSWWIGQRLGFMGCIVCGESSLSEQVESSFVRQGTLKKTMMTTMTEEGMVEVIKIV